MYAGATWCRHKTVNQRTKVAEYLRTNQAVNNTYMGTVSADHKLVIDTTKLPYSITERGAGDDVVADRYQLCDFTTERFFHLQHGANRISVSHEGINTLNVIVEGRISYETV